MFLVALELYGDDLQLAITFILADVEPSSVASFGDHFGRGHMRHYLASGGSTDAVLARRLREPNLHQDVTVQHNCDSVKHRLTWRRRTWPAGRPRHRGPSRPAIMSTSSPWPGWRCSAWCSIGPFVATTGCNRLPGGLSASAGAQVLAHGRADHLGDTGALFGGSQEQVTLEVRIQAHRLDRGSRRAHGRAARLATLEDLIDVVALLGFVSHRLDHLVGDRGATRGQRPCAAACAQPVSYTHLTLPTNREV